MEEILSVNGLHVDAEDQEILHGIDIRIKRGETHVIMGPNGAGKSTFGNALMGNPSYKVTEGSAYLNGEDLLEMAVNERAKNGLFMSFQSPIEVPGITLENFVRTAVEQKTGERPRLWKFRKEMKAVLETLQMDESYISRDLNVGFSGGEKKKAEIIQMLMLKPSLAVLDETDSGLDVDAVRTVSRGIEEFQKNKDSSLIIITHNTGILASLDVDKVHVLVDGKIVAEGDAELIDEINRDGFTKYEKEEQVDG